MRRARAPRWLAALVLVTLSTSVRAFSFNISEPTQCGQTFLRWDGGTPPYELIMVPTTQVPLGIMMRIEIPPSANSAREYNFTLVQPAGLGLVMTMSDDTGFGAGGSTPVLNVGSSSNSSCLEANGNTWLDFTFALSSNSPSQCSSLTVDWADNATSPVLHGMIPGGSAWTPSLSGGGGGSGSWEVNVASGTQFLLLMTGNGPRGFGGSTDLLTVGGGSGGCVTGSSPSANSSFSGQSFVSPGSGSGGNNGTDGGGGGNGNGNGNGGGGGGGEGNGGDGGGSGGGTPTGAIVGGTLGGLAFIVLLALLAVCFLRRRTKERRNSTHSTLRNYGLGPGEKKSGERHRSIDLFQGGSGAESGGVSSGSGAIAAGAAGAGFGAAAGTGAARSAHAEDTTSIGRSDVEGGEYEPSPFRYPSPAPGSTGDSGSASVAGTGVGDDGHAGLGGAAAAAAAATAALGAGAAGASASPREKRRSRLTMVTELEPDDQLDTPRGQRFGEVAPSDSDRATVGHVAAGAGAGAGAGAETARRGSTHKPSRTAGNGNPSAADVPSTGDVGGVGSSTPPSPPTPAEGQREARFVQHEDAGEIIDLPPRYDQLRR